MEKVNSFIEEQLSARKENFSLRSLTTNHSLIDFCSNDYLGFSRSKELKSLVDSELAIVRGIGSTGSRLISGNSKYIEDLEKSIAEYHGFESALIFNSGYDANLGIFSSIPQRGDTIILDEFIHASIIDGARLSNANRYTFKHNDLKSLEEKLQQARGNIFIGIESVYSMDGDEAPLDEIATLATKYGAALIVDEAHAIGIFGSNGRGLVHQNELQDKVFATVITFGKALGCHGAAILGRANLQQFLINFARSFIYTTAASPGTHCSIKTAYKHLSGFDNSEIHRKISLFRNTAGELYEQFIPSRSTIQSLIVPGNDKVKALAKVIQDDGFDVRAILHPTVPEGKERLRICLHIFNTDEEIVKLVGLIKQNI